MYCSEEVVIVMRSDRLMSCEQQSRLCVRLSAELRAARKHSAMMAASAALAEAPMLESALDMVLPPTARADALTAPAATGEGEDAVLQSTGL
jgi:hypothetical protein